MNRLKIHWHFALLHLGIAWYLFVMVTARALWWFNPRLSARWCVFTGLYEACRQLVAAEQLSASLSRDT